MLSRDFTNPASRAIPREGKNFYLRDREEVQARIELSGLAPDDYEIVAAIPGVATTESRARFTIRRGDEDVPTARLHYRYRADKVLSDFHAYEAILRELMASTSQTTPAFS